MATILKNYNLMALPAAIDRQNPIPLDSKALWYDYDALVQYAAEGATAYVGQLVVYVNETEGKSYVYVIQNDGTLGEIGGNSAATNVDGISIELSDENTLSLYGYGKEYYKYNSAQGVEGEDGYIPAGYTLTQGWVAGLEPRVIEKDGAFVLGWYEPNTDTMEGLNTTVGTLGTKVENLAEDVEDLDILVNGGTNSAGEEIIGLTTRVGSLENTVKNLTSAFVFKGVVEKVSELTSVANPQNGWVYKVTDTDAEYVYDGSNWIELGTVYEVDLTDYAKTTEVNTLLQDYVKTTALGDYAKLTDLEDLVTEQEFSNLAGRVGTLENALADDGIVGTLNTKVNTLETVIGDTSSGLVADVASLQEAVGAPATEDAEATGLYKVVGDLKYIATIKIGDTILEPDADRQVELPNFNGSVAGLVPVKGEAIADEVAASYFLNATGSWAIPVDERIGSLTYKEKQYTTVEEYIEAYVADHGMVWEPI